MTSNDRLLTPDELESELRAIGAVRYHHLHPFHKLLHGGKLSKQQVQAWALNRYYYQVMIPIKDAHALSKLPTSALRREWRRRIIDHDGDREGTGGIESFAAIWLVVVPVEAALSASRRVVAFSRNAPRHEESRNTLFSCSGV